MEKKKKSEARQEFEKRILNLCFANCGPLPTEETLDELDEAYIDKQKNKEEARLPRGRK